MLHSVKVGPDLSSAKPRLLTIPADSTWYRSHPAEYSPLYFGRSKSNRWDAPAKDYGVLYAAETPACAFMESIGREYLRFRAIEEKRLARCFLASFQLTRPLSLIDLATSGGLTRVGAEGNLTNSLTYEISQGYSAALRNIPAKPDGIHYRARHDPALHSIALFDHAGDALSVPRSLGDWLSYRELPAILRHYDLGLA